MQVFAEKSFVEARISDIAERAGMSYGAFYHYFDSKDQLFREVATTAVERLGGLVQSLLGDQASSAPLTERLRTALRNHFETYSAEVQVLAEIERVARNDEQVNAIRLEHYQQYYDEMAASIRELQRRGMADPALDPAIISAALGALVWRFAEVWLSFEYVSCDLDDAVDQITRIFVKVLRPEGGHGPLTAH